MVESFQDSAAPGAADAGYKPYDGNRLSYAGTFTNPWKAGTIRAVEWLTAKPKLLSLIRRYEREGVNPGQQFWYDCLRIMGIEVLTPAEQIARIPKEGPLVVVANHPHGLVDGMILAALVGQVRDDYIVLTRSLLTGIPEIEKYMVPVAFPHEAESQRLNIEMRKKCMAQLGQGGVVILFPAGSVACSKTWFGPSIEPEWNPFTAKMILRSGAQVLPIRFTGSNSRFYQIANLTSITLRQGLLLYEVRRALNKPQNPIVGAPISHEKVREWSDNPRGLMAWLRESTLGLT